MLTPNEYEIIKLMWNENRPLTRSEIVQLLPEKSWSDSSIHILLNSLLKKKAIEVCGFVKTNKNYGRTYSYLISKDEYLLTHIKQAVLMQSDKPINLLEIFSALINDKNIDKNTITELENLLEKKRKEIQG